MHTFAQLHHISVYYTKYLNSLLSRKSWNQTCLFTVPPVYFRCRI